LTPSLRIRRLADLMFGIVQNFAILRKGAENLLKIPTMSTG